MLATTLGGHIHHRSLEQLQEPLLHALATHVAGDAGVVALTGNLIYLVNEDDTAFGSLHVEVGHLQQSAQDALHILTHMTGLGQHRCIDNGEGHVQLLGNGTSQQGLTCTR